MSVSHAICSLFQVPFGKPIEEVYSGVHDGPVLGSGISGIVRLATHQVKHKLDLKHDHNTSPLETTF
jgi:hypothetical protein